MTDASRPGTGRPEDSAPRRPPRNRRTLTLAALLVAIAFVPFGLVFLRISDGVIDNLPLSEEDKAALSGGLRMVSPRFTGRTENGEPYVIEAEWALPNGPKPSRITLNELSATLDMEDGREARITSERGIYFPLRERLELKKGVRAETSDGYTMTTPMAVVDVAAKRLTSEGGIEAQGPRGSIRADSLEALDGASRMVKFVGNVRVTFVPEAGLSESQSPR